jgi:hypothetical protein
VDVQQPISTPACAATSGGASSGDRRRTIGERRRMSCTA